MDNPPLLYFLNLGSTSCQVHILLLQALWHSSIRHRQCSFPTYKIVLYTTITLPDKIPASLVNASALQDIELYANYLTGSIPSSLEKFQILHWLDIFGNQLETKDITGWGFMMALTNCTNLQLLDVGFNMLGGRMPNSIANLSTRLEMLLLGVNQISGVIPGGTGKLINLNFLRMGTNLLQACLLVEIGSLWRL